MRWLALLGFALCSLPSAAQDDREAVLDSFREALRRWEPHTGTWEVRFPKADPDAYGGVVIGYDWTTRAWYHAVHLAIRGREGDGDHYSGGTESLESLRDVHVPPGVDSSGDLDIWFPGVLVRGLVERPEPISRATMERDGTMVVVASWLDGQRFERAHPATAYTPASEPRDVTMVFDRHARLVRWSVVLRDGQTSGVTLAYNQSDRLDMPPVPARIDTARGTVRGTVIRRPGSNPELFERERVMRVAWAMADDVSRFVHSDNPWRGDTRDDEVEALRVAFDPNAAADAGSGANAPAAAPAGAARPRAARESPPGPWDGYRLPLVLGGVVLIVVGGAVWWKRRG